MLFPKKLPDPPKWNWKAWLKFSPNTSFWKDKPDKEKKAQKPIPKISKKKLSRIKHEWKETEIFDIVWNERPHECVKCRKKLKKKKIHNFDHIIPKSRGEQYRLDPDNIQILCFWCHYEKTTWQNYKWIDLDK